MRYFVVHLHDLLQPEETAAHARETMARKSPPKKPAAKSGGKGAKPGRAK
jgi:hypothetical protein